MIDIAIPNTQAPEATSGENTKAPIDGASLPSQPMPDVPVVNPMDTQPQPQPQATPSVLDRAGIDESDLAESTSKFHAMSELARSMAPRAESVAISVYGAQGDSAYKNVLLAQRSGLPQELVAADPQTTEDDLIREGTIEALDGFPSVARWALNNPESAKVASTDWENFTMMEANARAWSDVHEVMAEQSQNLSKGWQAGAYTARVGEEFYRDPNSAIAKALDKDFEAFSQTLTEEEQDSLLYNIGQIAGTMGFSGRSFFRGAAPTLTALIPAAVATPVVGQAVGGMAAIVGLAGAWNATREIEAGNFIREAMKRGISEAEARQTAELVGQINGILEVGGDLVLGKVLSPMLKPVLKSALSRVGLKRMTVSEGLQRPTVAKVLGTYVAGAVTGGTSEATTESLQDVVTAYAESALDVAQGLQTENRLHTLDGQAQLAAEVQKTWWNVFKATAVMGGVASAVGLPSNIREARRATQAQQSLLQALNEGKQSETGQKYPEVVQDYQEQTLRENGVEALYVDNAAFAQAMKDRNVTLDDIQGLDSDLAERVQKAIDEGGDVVIPAKTYAQHIAGTPLADRLESDIRLSEDALSTRELMDKEAKANAMFAQAMKAADEQALQSQETARKEEMTLIFDDVRDAIVKAGRKAKEADSYALLTRNFFDTQASRLGMSPLQLYEQFGPTIKKMVSDPVQALTQPDAKLIDMQRRSYAFDEQLRLWEQGKGEADFNIGSPSWVLQLFGVDPSVPVTASRDQFVHVQFAPGTQVEYNGKSLVGKHRMPADELRGLLVAIQRPLAVFESSKSTPQSRSIVLLTELTHQGKKGPQTMVAPVRLTVTDNGRTVTVNEIKTVHGKRKLPMSWIKDGLLLGYEKTKGLEILQQFHRSTSSTAGSNPSGNRSDSSTPLVSKAIVYENETSVEDLYQSTDSGVRGTYTPATRTIGLTSNADASTFLHELGHFFLDTSMQLAKHENATPQMKEDVQTLLEWFGVESLEAWEALGVEGQRKYHEQFAYNYEQYLFEGKAPSGRMRSLFKRFTQWLQEVYLDVRLATQGLYKAQFGEELPELSDGVRLVMDRLIASDAMVERTVRIRGLEPLMATQDWAGMSVEERAQYLLEHQEAIDEAKTLLRVRSLRDARRLVSTMDRERRAAEAAIREKRSELRKKYTDELSLDPFYRAVRYLRTGEIVDAQGEVVGKEDSHRLNAQENVTKDKRITNLTAVKDGRSSSYVIDLFGLEMDPQQFVAALIERPKLSDAVKARVDLTMQEEFADLTDPEAINQRVTEAVSNEAFTRVIATEFKALKAASTPARQIAEYAKITAKNVLGKSTFFDINVGRYARAETKARNNAERALAKGDLQLAAEFKRQELLNHELARQAKEAIALKTSLGELRKKVFVADKRLSKTRDMDHVMIVRSLFTSFGLATDGQTATVDKALKVLTEHDNDMGESVKNHIGGIQDFVKGRKGRELTYNDMLCIAEAMNAEWAISRQSKLVTVDGQKVEQELVQRDLLMQASETFSNTRRLTVEPVMSGSETDKEKWKSRTLSLNARLRRVNAWVRAMDGGKRGAFTKYIYEPIVDATTKFRTEKGKYMRMLKEAFSEFDFTDQRFRAAELDNPGWTEKYLTKQQIVHAVLHCGNGSNKRKLLLGYGWGKMVVNPRTGEEILDTSKWDAFIARMQREGVLTKKDYDAIQKIWDILDKLVPDAQKTHKELYGYYFDQIPAEPVITPFGVYRGGYVPAIVDPRRVDNEKAAGVEEKLGMLADNYMMPQAPNGFTKQRIENYDKPLLLDLNMFAGHVDKVLRFTYIAPRAREVYRLIGDPRSPLRKLIMQYDPHVIEGMIVPWLNRAQAQAVSKPSDTTRGSKDMDNLCRLIRTRVSMATMAGNVLNTIQQYTGLTIALTRVSKGSLFRAMREYTISPNESRRFVTESSEWMRQRLEQNLFELSGELENLIMPKSKWKDGKEWIEQHAYFMQQYAQNTIDVPVWLAAYADAIENGKNEKDAVRHADDVVRSTQGSFNPEDISSAEAGTSFARLFTMFYSYYNMQYNLLATEMGHAWMTKKYTRAAYVYFMALIMPTLLSEMLMGAVGGFDEGDDGELDGWDLLRINSSSFAAANFAMVPILGNLASVALGNRDRFIPSPGVQAGEVVFKKMPKYLEQALDEEADINSVQATKDTLNVISYFSGIPLGQLGKPLGYSAGVVTGDVTPESVSDIVRGMLSGRDVNR